MSERCAMFRTSMTAAASRSVSWRQCPGLSATTRVSSADWARASAVSTLAEAGVLHQQVGQWRRDCDHGRGEHPHEQCWPRETGDSGFAFRIHHASTGMKSGGSRRCRAGSGASSAAVQATRSNAAAEARTAGRKRPAGGTGACVTDGISDEPSIYAPVVVRCRLTHIKGAERGR